MATNPLRRIARTFRTIYKHGATNTPSNSNVELAKENRASLLLIAQQTSSTKVKIDVFKTLYRLQNYRSALEAAKLISTQEITLKPRLQILRAMLLSNQGVQSDLLLRQQLSLPIERSNYSPDETVSLADHIYYSGLPQNTKSEEILKICNFAKKTYGDHLEQIGQLAWIEYRVRTASNDPIDPLEYREIFLAENAPPNVTLRFIEPLFDHGHNEEANRTLDSVAESCGLQDPNVFLAFLQFCPDRLISHYRSTDKLPAGILRSLGTLRLSSRRKGFDEFHQQIFEESAKCIKESFAKSDIFKKNLILKTFLELDLQTHINDLQDLDSLPDTLLSRLNIEGFRFFESDDFRSAKDTFLAVLQESPGDSIASAGLRLVIPRTGGVMADEIAIRANLGCGLKGHGRTGQLPSSSDHIFSLMSSGKYIKALGLKRNNPHLQILKKNLQDKFLNYEKLPSDLSKKNVFIIADDGVGDEIRFAQFYSQVARESRSLTITCDPRLENIFTNSFPTVQFLPTTRYRTGVLENIGNAEERLFGMNKKLSNLLTPNAWAIATNADYICISQNLLFNKFIGRLHAPRSGGYLLPKHEKNLECSPLRIGILWRSHLLGARRKYMYLSIEDFCPLTQVPDIEIYSLQHCISAQERAACLDMGIKLIDDVDLYNDFDGLAGKLAAMDLLVGVSSVPIELGAAIGVPVWMLGFSPENYYLRTAGGTTSVDQLTHNSTIVAPPWVDFSEPVKTCKLEVMDEVCRRILEIQSRRQSSSHTRATVT